MRVLALLSLVVSLVVGISVEPVWSAADIVFGLGLVACTVLLLLDRERRLVGEPSASSTTEAVLKYVLDGGVANPAAAATTAISAPPVLHNNPMGSTFPPSHRGHEHAHHPQDTHRLIIGGTTLVPPPTPAEVHQAEIAPWPGHSLRETIQRNRMLTA